MFRPLTCSLTLSLVLPVLASGYAVAGEHTMPHSMTSGQTLMLAENGAHEKRRHAPKANANRKQAPLSGDTATHEKRVAPEAMSSELPTKQSSGGQAWGASEIDLVRSGLDGTDKARHGPETGLPTGQFTPSNGNNDALNYGEGGVPADDQWEERKRVSPGAANQPDAGQAMGAIVAPLSHHDSADILATRQSPPPAQGDAVYSNNMGGGLLGKQVGGATGAGTSDVNAVTEDMAEIVLNVRQKGEGAAIQSPRDVSSGLPTGQFLGGGVEGTGIRRAAPTGPNSQPAAALWNDKDKAPLGPKTELPE